jgi:hypothetical protein
VVSGFPAAAGACLVALLAGCAANGVTLRSNYYRVYVPPEWQVVEQGGDSEIPTLLRVPAAAEGVPGVELRLYPWLAEGPLADPTSDALKHLADAGILVGDAARLEDEGPPCPAQNLEFFVFGKPARTIHVLTSTGRAGVITAGYAYGSLVGIVALATSNRPTCAEVQTMVSAIRRVTISLAATGDATRVVLPPTIGGPQGLPIPPVDPSQLTP